MSSKWLFWWKKTFLMVLKQILRFIKNFQNWSTKNLKGDHRTKGGTIGKKFFRNVFLWVQNDCFDERNVFDGFKAIWSLIKSFQNWSKKSLRGDHRIKGATIGKKFFETCFYELKIIVLMKENVFDGFKAVWRVIKNFQNWSKKNVRVTIGPKGGPLE